MLGQDLRGQGDSLLSADDTVRPHLEGELVKVQALPHAGGLHVIVHLVNRGVDGIYRKLADHGVVIVHVLLVALGGHVTAALVERQLHVQLRAFAQSRDVHLGVEDFDLAVTLDGIRSHKAGALRADLHRLGAVAVQLRRQSLDVEDNLGHVLLHTGNGRKLVQNAVDLDACNGNARQRGEQHTAQAVAKRVAESALKGFHHKLAIRSIAGKFFCLNLRLLYLDH